MRVTTIENEDGSGMVERKIAKQAQGIELRLLSEYGLQAGDKVILTQYPDGSGEWRKV